MPFCHWLSKLHQGWIRTHRSSKLRPRRRAQPDWTAACIQRLEPRLMLDGTNDPPSSPPPLSAAEVETQRIQIESDHQSALAAIRQAVLNDWNSTNQGIQAGYATRAQTLEIALAASAARLDTAIQATETQTHQTEAKGADLENERQQATAQRDANQSAYNAALNDAQTARQAQGATIDAAFASAVNAAESAFDTAVELADTAYSQAATAITSTYESTVNAAGSAYDSAMESATAAYEAAGAAAESTYTSAVSSVRST